MFHAKQKTKSTRSKTKGYKSISTLLNLSEILNVSRRTRSSFIHVYDRIHSLAASVNRINDGAYRNTRRKPQGIYIEVVC